ncbi:MAG TPA: DoxX family protein [Sphingomicrobium sp.]
MEDPIRTSSAARRFPQIGGLSAARPIALLLLRLVIGYGFLAHGYAKLHRGPDKFAALLTYLAVPFPHFTAWFVTLVELIGGFALIVGAFVLLLSVPLIILHLVAMSTIHIHYGFSSVNTIGLTGQGPLFGPPGFEISLLYIGGILVLAAFGPGPFSVDGALARERVRDAP